MAPRLQLRGLRYGFPIALFVLLAASGALLLTDRTGLRAEYFALAAPWEGEPLGRSVAAPGLDSASQVGKHLATPVVFSIRWRGWWEVAQGGEHRFFLDADDGGYLRIDDQLIAEAAADDAEPAASGRVALAPGFHEIEVGYFQNSGDARLVILRVPPGAPAEAATSLPPADLYAARPLAWRKLLRRLPAPETRTYRQLLGALLLLGGLTVLGGCAAPAVRGVARLRRRLRAADRSGLRSALLVGLFIVVFLAIFPYTGTVVGGDDTSYLDTATFDVKTWYVNRYGHVYLLKLFTALSGGDPLLGVRVWWSFVMAATVAALAVAVRAVGPGLQLRTLAATLFVLLAQPTLWGLIGAGFADYSAMMFVTVAVATCLHGVARDRERPPPRHEWHPLWVGALTVGAMRSKEVGAVLLLLPLLFAIGPGTTLARHRFVRKVAYWSAGAGAAYALLLALDGWILGDFFFSWDRERLAILKEMNFPATVATRKESWLENLWHGREMRYLWTGVAAAAVTAGACRRELQLRLLHLLPIAYLLALIALYVRLPHPISNRMLIPILPTACLMTGLLLHYAGLDDVPWRRLAKPGVLIAGGMAAAVVFLVMVPLQRGTLEAAALLPVGLLRRYGWKPEQFVAGVLLPAAVLIALGGAALGAARRPPRLAALLMTFLVLYGVGFEISRSSLARKWAVQTGQLLLYPWRTFRQELGALPAVAVALSADLRSHFRMSATTRTSLARLALGRPDIRVRVVQRLPADAQAAIASRNTYLTWLQEMPTLAETARFDSAGFLVLVHPRAAAERLLRLPAGSRPGPAPQATVEGRLNAVRTSRDSAARRELLQWILANPLGSRRSKVDDLFSLHGTQLRAVALHRDGWTYGASPAGLVVDNRAPSALAQRITLVVGDATRQLPVQVFIDDGERVESVRFERAESRTVELQPVAPFATRLFLVWADAAWTPAGGDRRQLGVQILAPELP